MNVQKIYVSYIKPHFWLFIIGLLIFGLFIFIIIKKLFSGEIQCVHGKYDKGSKRCICDTNWNGLWYGKTCDKECTNSETCNGHGTCNEDGSCSCDTGIFVDKSKSSVGWLGSGCDICNRDAIMECTDWMNQKLNIGKPLPSMSDVVKTWFNKNVTDVDIKNWFFNNTTFVGLTNNDTKLREWLERVKHDDSMFSNESEKNEVRTYIQTVLTGSSPMFNLSYMTCLNGSYSQCNGAMCSDNTLTPISWEPNVKMIYDEGGMDKYGNFLKDGKEVKTVIFNCGKTGGILNNNC